MFVLSPSVCVYVYVSALSVHVFICLSLLLCPPMLFCMSFYLSLSHTHTNTHNSSQLVPLIRQANILAQDLKRPVTFAGKLQQSQIGSKQEPKAVVEVTRKWSDTPVCWDFETFQERYAQMETVYRDVRRAHRNNEVCK